MAGDQEQELTPDEITALADEIRGQVKDDGHYWDDVARAVAHADTGEDEA